MIGPPREVHTTAPAHDRLARVLSIATLERSRAELRGPAARALAVCVAVAYAFIGLQVGLMLTFEQTGQHSTTSMVLWGAQEPAWWNYPALLVIFPGGILALPFFGTLVMLLASIGVGIGMTVGIVLTARVIARRRRALGRPAAAGAVAGLTPAMIGLVTLGACCSTTAAATAGIGALAQASGSNLDALLANNWYIGVFQLTVLWVALVAQEQLLSVYGILLGAAPDTPPTESPSATSPSWDRRFVAVIALRVALMAAGVTWALVGIAQWGFGAAVGPIASNWFGWVLTHGLLSMIAVLAGIFPRALLGWWQRASRLPAAVARGVLLIIGVSQLTWLPVGVASEGWHGLGNELLAAAGAPSAWGPISAGSIGTTALVFRWSVQFALLGAFALALALVPGRTAAALAATSVPDRRRAPAIAGSAGPGAPAAARPTRALDLGLAPSADPRTTPGNTAAPSR